MPKVSVIVPVYNVEQYLRQCLDSIINQTFKDFECICVNDGSTDNSLTILQEYSKKDNRIKIINQKNSGSSVSRNNGIKQALGQYVSFVDADDWITDNYLEILYNKIIET
nr:glycosyltransferase [Endomicrobiaceae bacterium]